MAGIYVVILDVNVQSMLARTAAGFFSKKLDTEVKIKTFYIQPDLSVHAEEVQINDKKHLPMLYVGEMNGKISLTDIADELRVKSLIMDDVLVNIVTYEDEYTTNLAELFATNDEKPKEKHNPKIYLDKLDMSNGHVVVWDQNKDKPEKESMDYSHLDVDSIHLSMENMSFLGDTISGVISRLSATDKSGFKIDRLASSSPFIVSSRLLDFKNLNLTSHSTDLDLDLKFIYSDYKDYRKFVDSVMIIANIRPSQLTLSDLRYFSPKMSMMTDTLQIKGLISGCVNDFTANKFSFSFKDSTSFVGNVKMKGLPKFHKTHIVANVEKMKFTYQDISEFAIPTYDGKIPIPEMLSSLNEMVLSGDFYGFHNNFNTKFNLHTSQGNIFFNGALNNDLYIVPKPYYFCMIHANNLNVSKILNLKDELVVSMYADLMGEGMSKEDADLDISFNIEKLKTFGNEFENIVVDANMENQRIIASSDFVSDFIKTDFVALLDISKTEPSIDLNIDVKDADFNKLGLIGKDKTMVLSTNIDANLRGMGIDNIFGTVVLDNTTLYDSRGSYFMDSMNIVLKENYFDSKDLIVDCDFFDLNVNGIFNFAKLNNTAKNYVRTYFNVANLTKSKSILEDKTQDFYVHLTMKDTETLSRLLCPQLSVGYNTVLTATFTSNNYRLNSTLESDKVTFGDMIFDNVYIRNKTEKDKTIASVNVKEFVFKEATETNDVRLGLDNVNFIVDAHNDSLLVKLLWDDNIIEDKNKGELKAVLLPYDKDYNRLYLTSSDIRINDTLWNMSPDCYIDFVKNNISFNGFKLYSNTQSVSLNGVFPKTNADTLSVDFDKLDISNFDLLTSGYGVDVDGYIDGSLRVSGIKKKLTVLSNLDVKGLGINGHVVGNAFMDANWNAPDSSMFIDTEVIKENGEDKLISFIGKYYTSRKDNNLDFELDMNDIDISLVNSFTKKILERVEGKLDSDINISGSLKKPVLRGYAMLNDGAFNINYLNTYYKVNPSGLVYDNLDTYIKLSENKIEVHDIVLVDTLNNLAVADGIITHDYLKDFKFDVSATLDNFLSMNIPSERNTSFYGNAIASGDLKIDGPLDDIVMDIDALSMPGTVIDIVLNSATSVNDDFIVFVQPTNKQDTVVTIIPEKQKDKKFTLNLDADVTQSAKVNIHLSSNIGNIEAEGSGKIRLGVAPEQLSLYGDYVIDNGNFVFNFQNLIRREFVLKQGGTLSWTGKADDADINVTGSYRTKASISTLGLEIDSTSLVNNINVDCIVHLKDKLTSPTLTFGLSLPDATDDVANTVFSIIDTTNQAVMTQQIISLLVFGTFSYSNANLYDISASNYYNILTNTLSSWLSQISDELDIKLRYTPENNMTAEEYEMSMSTQMFNDRLTIEGNFGVYTGEMPAGFNNIVGDFDLTWKVNNNISLYIYNHSNLSSNYYTYSYEMYSPYTQALGVTYSKSFDNIKDILPGNKKKRNNKRNKVK